jgi:hypothetical protein
VGSSRRCAPMRLRIRTFRPVLRALNVLWLMAPWWSNRIRPLLCPKQEFCSRLRGDSRGFEAYCSDERFEIVDDALI